MSVSTKSLPKGYVQSGEINLAKNKRLTIGLYIVALFVTVLSFYLLAGFEALARPGLPNVSGSISLDTIRIMGIIVGLYVLLIGVHELIHGFFFWVFTHNRPVFGFRMFYAFAGAPAWYIPKRQFAIVALGPLVIIGVVGMLLLLVVPASWLLAIKFFVALNTGGAVGDFLAFTRLFKLPETGLTNDTGEVVTFYESRLAIPA